MSLKARLVELAKFRTKVVEIEDLKVVVREVNSVDFAKYGKLHSEDPTRAIAHILKACVFHEDGQTPVFDDEESAMAVAESARASSPIVNTIMNLSGYGSEEKKEADEKHSDAS